MFCSTTDFYPLPLTLDIRIKIYTIMFISIVEYDECTPVIIVLEETHPGPYILLQSWICIEYSKNAGHTGR